MHKYKCTQDFFKTLANNLSRIFKFFLNITIYYTITNSS